MGRNPCCSRVSLKRGAWTADEDKLLTDYIKLHGEGNWRLLPKRAGLERCGKSCRLRWLNYLRPDIKRGNITEDEEDLIIRLHKLLGNRWSLIAGRIPGRTDNEIKNYWNTTLGKRVHDQSNSSASTAYKHANQSDKKKTKKKKRTAGIMAPRSTPNPDSQNKIHHSPAAGTNPRTRFSNQVFTSQQQKDVETNKPFTHKDSFNSKKIETGFTERLQSLSPGKDNSLAEYLTLEELNVSNFISSGLGGFLEFSYGNGHGKAFSSSLDGSLMSSDEMLEDWAKNDYLQPEINSDNGLESHSRVV